MKAKVCTRPRMDRYCNWGKSNREDHPINCINWNQARISARWLGGDLPTEAQWEYAARSGGKPWKYPWGNQKADCLYAVMDDGGDGCGKDRTWPICSKPKGNTSQGLCDMSGSVWECTRDIYKNYNSNKSDDLPVCSLSSCNSKVKNRVFRGGSWNGNKDSLRVSDRDHYKSTMSDYQMGFRVLLFPSTP